MTNYACLGYMISAIEVLNLDEEEINKAVDEMYALFDILSEQQAEKKYFAINDKL